MTFSQLYTFEKIYVITAFISGFGSIILGCIVYLKNRGSTINRAYLFMSLSVAVWSFGLFNCHTANNVQVALFWNKFLHFGSLLIPISVFNFTTEVLELNKKKIRLLNVIGYIIVAVLAGFLFTDYFIAGLGKKFIFHLWPIPGQVYTLFILYFAFYNYLSLGLLLRSFLKEKGIKRQQIKFILIGLSIAIIGGSSNFAYFYDIPMPPVGNFFVFLYVVILAYTIVKYRFMDITIVFTRISIFVIVYTMVLGIPFGVGLHLLGIGSWLMPMTLMAVLATVGPFIYLYIQKRAEEALLREQRQYQTTLRQASMGMGQIKDLKRLLKLIVHIVTRAVSIEHCKIFLLHEESRQLTLKASRGKQLDVGEGSVLALDSPLVNHLKKVKEPVVYEEIKQRAQDYNDDELKGIESDISKMGGALVVPSFIEQKLIAMLVLGKKKSGKIYTQDDLAVFSILANQAGLAIENAQFYEKMKDTHQQLIKAEKMATVGTMADGLSHQINNRLHAMGFIAGDALDTIKLKKKEKLSPDILELLDEIEHSLSRIEDNVKRGGEIVEGLLKYTRKGSEGFEAINLNKLLDASFEMAQFKIKINEMNIVRSFDDSIPNIKGNFTQLQEVFFNIIDNAYDAMMQRKTEMKESGYKANLKIWAGQKDGKLEILIEDNGIGVKKENLEKLFTPFFTTKLSSKKGTGLGLYVIRQIIEENHKGKVKFTSQYKRGSQTRILLPIVAGGVEKKA